MDMLEGVGRRSGTDQLLDLGHHSLNGYERNSLFRNDGDGSFTELAWLHRADREEDGRGVAVFDFDRDGRLDIAVRNYRQPASLLHNAGATRHWVSFELVGKQSNRDAVGARLRLRTGDAWQTRVPAVAGTDLSPDAALPLLAVLAYVGAGALLGLLHPLLGMGAPVLLLALAGEHEPLAVALALTAVGTAFAGLRHPRIAGATAAVALAGGWILPRSEPPHAGTPGRPDVVLVVLDTVGAGSTSLHGADLPTTPVLESLAREGIWFRRAVATAPWTVPSHASLLTGEHPRTLGCHHEHPALSEGGSVYARIPSSDSFIFSICIPNLR